MRKIGFGFCDLDGMSDNLACLDCYSFWGAELHPESYPTALLATALIVLCLSPQGEDLYTRWLFKSAPPITSMYCPQWNVSSMLLLRKCLLCLPPQINRSGLCATVLS